MQTELWQIKFCQLLSRHKGFTCYPELQCRQAETLKHTGISQVPSADDSRVMGLSKVICFYNPCAIISKYYLGKTELQVHFRCIGFSTFKF